MFRGTSLSQKNLDNLIEEWSKPNPWVEINKTIRAKQKEIYSVVANAMREITKAIKPGVMVSKVDSVGRDVINEAGYGDFTYPHLTAHGIGTRVHEKPYITEPGVDHKLEPGMVFAVEIVLVFPDREGYHVEDPILITEDGHRRLIDLPNETLAVKNA